MGQQSSRQPKSAPSARETNHRACLTRPHREGRGGAPIFLTRKTRSSQKTIRHISTTRMPRRGNRFHGTCTPSSLISKLCDSACPIAPASPAPWGGPGRGFPNGEGRGGASHRASLTRPHGEGRGGAYLSVVLLDSPAGLMGERPEVVTICGLWDNIKKRVGGWRVGNYQHIITPTRLLTRASKPTYPSISLSWSATSSLIRWAKSAMLMVACSPPPCLRMETRPSTDSFSPTTTM